MVGLDRAAVWVQLEVEADLVILGIQKRFVDVKPKKLAGNTQTFKLNENNLNEIRVKEKLGKTLVKIDFSYSKYGKENNLYPLENEISKIIVEEKLIDIIEDISLIKITRSDLNYDFIEVCTQKAVKSFYEYHNIISTFYKSLRRAIQHQQGVRFENYDLNLDFFYSTGFVFQMNPGWKMRLYSKTHEHNKKNSQNKIFGGNIRLEHRLTSTALNYFCKSSRVSEISIDILKEKVLKKIGVQLFKYLEAEIQRDIDILEVKLKNYTSRTLPLLVRDLQEHILDEETVNYVVTKLATTSERQIKRYRQKIKIALEEFQNKGSPKRSNFGNIERLEFFINKILLYQVKVKCKYKERLTFNAT